MREALFYNAIDKNKVQCVLCPHNCMIGIYKTGKCNVRGNINGKLYSLNFEKICSVNSDPIEKKPLYHFHPGKNIVSVGSYGCNLKCLFCQNNSISQVKEEDILRTDNISLQSIIKASLNDKSSVGIAYTYNEPVVWFEMMYETAVEIKKLNLKNVIVSNGYINPKPLEKLIPLLDAANIDLKAFTKKFYKEQTGSDIEPVKKTIKKLAASQVHLEITNLVIPDLNSDVSDFKEMIKFIKNESGEDTVLHLSKYFPKYKMQITQTHEKILEELYHIAKEELNYVYVGNTFIKNTQNTYCPKCNSLLIERTGYITKVHSISEGKCLNCNTEIPVIL